MSNIKREELATQLSFSALLPEDRATAAHLIEFIVAYTQGKVDEAEMRSQFFLMSELQLLIFPLMMHSYQKGFPEMSAEILKELSEWRHQKFSEAADVIIPKEKRAQLADIKEKQGE